MVLQKFPAVYPSATATNKDRRLARTKTVCRRAGLTPASHHCSCAHPQQFHQLQYQLWTEHQKCDMKTSQEFPIVQTLLHCVATHCLSLSLLTPGTLYHHYEKRILPLIFSLYSFCQFHHMLSYHSRTSSHLSTKNKAIINFSNWMNISHTYGTFKSQIHFWFSLQRDPFWS